jgi:DNA-binding IclR family transcriptional regulator
MTVRNRRLSPKRRDTVPQMLRGSPQTERLVETLELLAARRQIGATVTDIARHLGVDRSTCYPMLRQLCQYGWLIRDAHTKRFSLGPALVAVGATAASAGGVLDAARPAMTELADMTDLASVLVCASGRELVVAEITHPRAGRRPTLGIQIADTYPFTAPLGAVLVAWEDDRAHARWLGSGERRRDAMFEQSLRHSLKLIRRRGFAVEALDHPRDLQREVDTARARSMSRRETHAVIERIANGLGGALLLDDLHTRRFRRVLTLSAPIFTVSGHSAAALCLFDPPRMLDGAQSRALGQQVAAAAAHVSASLTV